MDKVIDYYLSLISPYTYMGGTRLIDIATRHGAAINYKPVDFGRVFPASGGLPLAKRAPQRLAYRMMELRRWRAHFDLPMNLEPKYFPAPDWPAAGLVVAARRQGLDCGGLSNAILRAVWEEERNIADAGTLSAIATECGLDGPSLIEEAQSDDCRRAYDADTDEAMARGVFGAPTYVFNGELFWGQDRLEFLDRSLAGG